MGKILMFAQIRHSGPGFPIFSSFFQNFRRLWRTQILTYINNKGHFESVLVRRIPEKRCYTFKKMNFRGGNLTKTEKMGSKLAIFDSSFFWNNHRTVVNNSILEHILDFLKNWAYMWCPQCKKTWPCHFQFFVIPAYFWDFLKNRFFSSL